MKGKYLRPDQTAQLVYLSAATNLDNCDAAIYMISEGRSPAWSEEAYTDIISYLAFMIQDTWRPVGMVDHITFFRNSGAAITVNETDRTLMYRFDSCLPNNTPGKDDSNLSGWDLARIAAAYCGDVGSQFITHNADKKKNMKQTNENAASVVQVRGGSSMTWSTRNSETIDDQLIATDFNDPRMKRSDLENLAEQLKARIRQNSPRKDDLETCLVLCEGSIEERHMQSKRNEMAIKRSAAPSIVTGIGDSESMLVKRASISKAILAARAGPRLGWCRS